MPSPRKISDIQIAPKQPDHINDSISLSLLERIAERAYSFYEERGRQDGFDLEDWLRAEREVLLESTIH